MFWRPQRPQWSRTLGDMFCTPNILWHIIPITYKWFFLILFQISSHPVFQAWEKVHFHIHELLVVNFAETRDGLDLLGAWRHLVSPNHPSFQQNYHLQNEWGKILFLHFELNYFTGVNRLTPFAKFPHTFKNEEKDIPHLVTKKWAWRKFNEVWNTELDFSREFLGYQVRYVLFFTFESVMKIGKRGQSIHTSEVI